MHFDLYMTFCGVFGFQGKMRCFTLFF